MALSAVILAAGHASRFGGCKALALIEGAPALLRCLGAFEEGGVETSIVVTGAWRDEIVSALERWGLSKRRRENKNLVLAHNTRFGEGMFTSVRTGLDALGDDCEGAFVHPVDIPLICPATVRGLSRAFRPSRWIVPVFEGKEGHPVLIPQSYRTAIRNWSGQGGLRGFLANREGEKTELPVFDEGILMDIDTPGDLEKLTSYARRRHVPGEAVIEALLQRAGTPPGVILHQRLVAEAALKIGTLYARHAPLDLGLLTAAAILHDILKTGSAHAERGAAFLAENGFPEVAEVVRGHTDLPSSASAETEILYLADKIVSGTEFVSLEEREKRVRKKFLSDETAMKAALRRMKLAFDVREKVERVTGIPLLSDRVPRP